MHGLYSLYVNLLWFSKKSTFFSFLPSLLGIRAWVSAATSGLLPPFLSGYLFSPTSPNSTTNSGRTGTKLQSFEGYTKHVHISFSHRSFKTDSIILYVVPLFYIKYNHFNHLSQKYVIFDTKEGGTIHYITDFCWFS